jgi:5-hydroxyisourate hydrolase
MEEEIILQQKNKINNTIANTKVIVMSQITTHILDTSTGKPVWGINVTLSEKVGTEWLEVAKAITNKDGRATNLLKEGELLASGVYKLSFDTKNYFATLEIETFYPAVEVIFEVKAADHYHVPLLLNPFGYSTYRGS